MKYVGYSDIAFLHTDADASDFRKILRADVR